MVKEIKRNVPASDYTQKEKPWDLTRAQWLVYYWLLAHSNRNPNPAEKHYFIYDNKYKKADIMRDCLIKSKSTICTAFKKLEEVGAIQRSTTYGPSYQIFYSTPYTPMDVRIIRLFIAYCDKFDSSQAIMLYAILKRALELNDNKPIDFSATLLSTLLGKVNQNVNKKEIVFILHFLIGWNLIKVKEQQYTNRLGVKCINYTLLEVGSMNNDLAAYFNEEGELDSKYKTEIWEQAAASFFDEDV